MNLNYLKRSLAGALAGVMTLGAVPFAGAAETTEKKTENKQISVTQSYINAVGGNQIAESGSYLADFKEYNPQDIKDYTYKNYTEEVQEIYESKCTQYIIGYPDKTVRMEANLTRDEVSMIFYRLYEGEYPESKRHMSDSTFKDVESSDWYYDALKKMYDLGIADGTTKTTFDPDLEITRAEFAKFAALFSGLDGEYEKAFSDVDKGHWAYDYINAAASKGWVNGYKDGTFHPDEKITRAEAMKFINGVVNRSVTTERLEELKVENPYIDLTKNHWAYNHAMEATIKHNHKEGEAAWHQRTYNDGKYDLQIERFVDEKGKVIAEQKTEKIEATKDAKKIPAFNHIGTLKIRTYVYSSEKSAPFIEKIANVTNSEVDDEITYTVKGGIDKEAVVDGKNGVFVDTMPLGVDFEYGSVQINGKNTNAYTYDENTRVLTVNVGTVKIGAEVEIKFAAKVNDTAYGTTIKNTATLTFDNADPVSDTDDGVAVADGKVKLDVTKAASAEEGSVGDTLNYSSNVTNNIGSVTNAKDVVWTDTLDEGLTFKGNVQVDGYSAVYSFDNETKTLTVKLGDIAPDQTKVVSFDATINSTAYGKTIYNTAVAVASNAPEAEGTDDGVIVADGNPNGHIGSKIVDAPTKKVKDTATYTIPLENGANATADWVGVIVTDVIPEGVTYAGNVKLNGAATTLYSYDAQTKTLTLTPDAIAPGEKAVFEFDVTVDEGSQGKYIVNTAILDDNGEKTQLPDTGIQVEDGDIDSYLTKKASVKEAMPGDIISWEIKARNGAKATAAWKNVELTDLVPDGMQFVAGSVTVNGQTESYGIAGQAIAVTIGDLIASDEVVITLQARVLDSAVGKTIHNVAVAEGDNGKETATDDGVTILDPEDANNDESGVSGSKTVDRTIVTVGDEATFTFVAQNNSEETWKSVQIYDVLDTSMVTLINDSIYIDGIRYTAGSGKWSFSDGQLVLNLGDIAVGKSATASFTVQFKNDAANSTYVNHATIVSTSHDNVYVKAPEIVILGGGDGGDEGKNPLPTSDIHHKLFSGDGSVDTYGMWLPSKKITVNDLCRVGYRIMTDYYKNSKGNGTYTIPSDLYIHNGQREVRFMLSHNVISASEFVEDAPATLSQIYRVLQFSTGADLGSGGDSTMSRIKFAELVCNVTGRDTSPNTNGLPIAQFPDEGKYSDLIAEVSNGHDYTKDSKGNETWIALID